MDELGREMKRRRRQPLFWGRRTKTRARWAKTIRCKADQNSRDFQASRQDKTRQAWPYARPPPKKQRWQCRENRSQRDPAALESGLLVSGSRKKRRIPERAEPLEVGGLELRRRFFFWVPRVASFGVARGSWLVASGRKGGEARALA